MSVLLDVKNLTTSFKTDNGVIRVVDNISFNINKGEVLGIVGESGCGKSITSLSIMGLVPQPNGFVESGEIFFDGTDLLKLKGSEIEKLRGNDMAMIFQEPMTALNPVLKIGDQIGEPLAIHMGLKGNENRLKCIELLNMVGLPRADEIIDEYPHQLSGGMKQRVMIAMALSCNPKLLIADEPTTALDVTIQAQILDLMLKLNQDMGSSLMFITHDLGVIAEIADQVAVMYLGKIVEQASVDSIFNNTMHPYTIGLLNSRPDILSQGEELRCIPGMVPLLSNKPKGCAFSTRCDKCMPVCREKMPELLDMGENHKVRCWLHVKER
jgi:oligopeptide/dipeptide ABC transporter ATP-binding protein